MRIPWFRGFQVRSPLPDFYREEHEKTSIHGKVRTLTNLLQRCKLPSSLSEMLIGVAVKEEATPIIETTTASSRRQEDLVTEVNFTCKFKLDDFTIRKKVKRSNASQRFWTVSRHI
jgi:hypothetical protein